MRSHLERPPAGSYAFGPFRLEPATRRLLRGSAAVHLRPKPFDLLVLLVEHHDRVVGKQEIMERLWPDTAVEEANLTQCVFVLRKALAQGNGKEEFIATSARHGYRFVAPVLELPAEAASAPVEPGDLGEDPGALVRNARPRAWVRRVRQAAGRDPVAVRAAAVLFIVIAVLVASFGRTRAPGPAERVVATLKMVGAPPVDLRVPGPVAISPDGTQVAMVAHAPHERDHDVWIRSLGGEAAHRVHGTTGASSLFWSPDAGWVAFFAGGKLKRVRLSGGPVDVVCDAPGGYGGTWSTRGVILFGSGPGEPLRQVPASGGEPTPVLTLLDGERLHAWPTFLPDGVRFLFSVISHSPSSSGIHQGLLDGSRTGPLFRGGGPTAISAGHVVAWRDNALRAQRLDPAGRLQGDEVMLATTTVSRGPFSGVAMMGGESVGVFSASASGAIVYLKSGPENSELRWLDRAGIDRGKVGWTAAHFTPRLSPDGRRVAVEIGSPEQSGDIWLLPTQPGAGENGALRLTRDPGHESNPVWSPDGSRLVFSSATNGARGLFEIAVDGHEGREIFPSREDAFPSDWSSDGRILFTTRSGQQLRVSAHSVVNRVDDLGLPPGFAHWDARLSPDSRWVAYTSNRSGRPQIYVQRVGHATPVRISNEGGGMPVWSRDQRELYYHTLQGNRLVAVPFTSVDGPRTDAQRTLFVLPQWMRMNLGAQYDLSPDGQRFLINMLPSEPAELTLIQNWAR